MEQGLETAAEGLETAERIVADALGQLMQFWGFKRNMGRIWAVLYLSERPLTAQDLQRRLMLSAGAVSTSLRELRRWGAVHKVWVQGARREHYAAEGHVWRAVSRVLAERERAQIQQAHEALYRALQLLERHLETRGESPDTSALRVQLARVRQLVELARLGRELLDALLERGRIDIGRLSRWLLGAEATH